MGLGWDVQYNCVLSLRTIALDQERSKDEAVSKLRSAHQHRTSQSYGVCNNGQRGIGVDPRLKTEEGMKTL